MHFNGVEMAGRKIGKWTVIRRKGYEPKNVWVVSFRANRIKMDATLSELRKIVRNLEKAC
jgi:hypothetical protein